MKDSCYIHIDGGHDTDPLDADLTVIRKRVESGMKNAADLIIDECTVNGIRMMAIMFDGLVSNSQVSDFLLRPLSKVPSEENTPARIWRYLNEHRLMSSEQGTVKTYRDLFTKAMSGFAIVLIDGW